MTIKKTHEAELDGVRYIKERDILVAPPLPPITLQMILHVVPFQGNCVANYIFLISLPSLTFTIFLYLSRKII